MAINNQVYDQYGTRWYTAYDDPIALLRAESRLKTPWILKHLQKTECASVLDVGCGGGFLSNALAAQGFPVTGVDLSQSSLDVARAHDTTKSVRYLRADAYSLPFPDSAFDAVTCMDFLEHVEQPSKVILECGRVLKPGGSFFFHTFNRNALSWLIVIKLVEWLVKNTPRDLHSLRYFIKPSELSVMCEHAGLHVREMTGIRPDFSSIRIKDWTTGVVPQSLKFELTPSLLLSYMGVASKSA
jgi:2-polyprenyl-6-hydroxyphenyl methylase/3-demethylubiquinone-9 3-methyltransferase